MYIDNKVSGEDIHVHSNVLAMPAQGRFFPARSHNHTFNFYSPTIASHGS